MNNIEKKREQSHNYRTENSTCSVSNCSINQGHYQEHKKTKKHQINLEKKLKKEKKIT